MAQTQYGDLTPQQAGYAQKKMLRRGLPFLMLEMFGAQQEITQRNTTKAYWRQLLPLNNDPNRMVEGVTMAAKKLQFRNVEATLVQYGDRVELTDVMLDTHPDPVASETVGLLGEQAAQMMERIRWGILIGGANVFYANGAARADVNTTLSLPLIRAAAKYLRGQNASKFTEVLRSSQNWGTQSIKPAWVGLTHANAVDDLRDVNKFQDVVDYHGMTPFENEEGAVENTRWVHSTVFDNFADAGAALGGAALESTGGANADVFPSLIVARDAYGIVPLRGKSSLTPVVIMPKHTGEDPHAQRAHFAWKTYQATVILQETFMCRIEHAVSQ